MRELTQAQIRQLQHQLRTFLATRAPADSVDDILQEALLRIHLGHAQLREPRHLRAWSRRIAARVAVDFQRAHHGGARLVFRGGSDLEGDAPTFADALCEAALREDLRHCALMFLNFLRPPYREALTFTDLQGLTLAEAACRAGVSLSGMKSRVQRGRSKLHHMFRGCCALSTDHQGRVTACEPRALPTVPLPYRAAAAGWGQRPRG